MTVMKVSWQNREMCSTVGTEQPRTDFRILSTT